MAITPPEAQASGPQTVEDYVEDISEDAINFEQSAFVEESKMKRKVQKEAEQEFNEHKNADVQSEEDGDQEDVLDFDNSEAEEFERQFSSESSDTTSSDAVEEETEQEKIERTMRELANQPFEVAMDNLEVSKEEVLHAARGVFSKDGYFEMKFDLPFGEYVVMRSKTVNDYVDYNSYVRRLLLDPISQKEYDTFTQMRNLSYAIVEIDGEDWRDLSVDERYDRITAMSDIKITAIVNATVKFWRITHLLLHPKAIDFFLHGPEE